MAYGHPIYSSGDRHWMPPAGGLPKKISKKKGSVNQTTDHAQEEDLTGSGRTPDRDGKTGERVARACIFCRSSKLKCDHQRPCSRCVHSKRAHLCVDAPPLRRPSNALPLTRPSAAARTAGRSRPDLRRRRDAPVVEEIHYDSTALPHHLLPTVRTHTPAHEYPSKRPRRSAYYGGQAIPEPLHMPQGSDFEHSGAYGVCDSTYVDYSGQDGYQYTPIGTAGTATSSHGCLEHSSVGHNCEYHESHDYDDDRHYLHVDARVLAAYAPEQQQLFLQQLSDHAFDVYGQQVSPADISAYIRANEHAEDEAHTESHSRPLQQRQEQERVLQLSHEHSSMPLPPLSSSASTARARTRSKPGFEPGTAPRAVYALYQRDREVPPLQLLATRVPYNRNALHASVPPPSEEPLLPSRLAAMRTSTVQALPMLGSLPDRGSLSSALTRLHRGPPLPPTAVSGPCGVEPPLCPPAPVGCSFTFGCGSTASLSLLLSRPSPGALANGASSRSLSAPCFTGLGGLFSTFDSPPQPFAVSLLVGALPPRPALEEGLRYGEHRCAVEGTRNDVPNDPLSALLPSTPVNPDITSPNRYRAPCKDSRKLWELSLQAADNIIPAHLPPRIRARVLYEHILAQCEVLGLPDDLALFARDSLQTLSNVAGSVAAADLEAVTRLGPLPPFRERLCAALARCVLASCERNAYAESTAAHAEACTATAVVTPTASTPRVPPSLTLPTAATTVTQTTPPAAVLRVPSAPSLAPSDATSATSSYRSVPSDARSPVLQRQPQESLPLTPTPTPPLMLLHQQPSPSYSTAPPHTTRHSIRPSSTTSARVRMCGGPDELVYESRQKGRPSDGESSSSTTPLDGPMPAFPSHLSQGSSVLFSLPS